MSDYFKSTTYTGNPEKAIEIARNQFVQAGYKITNVSDSEVSARQDGSFTRSMSGNTLYGASPVTVSVTGNQLIVRAGFEGLEKLKQFLLKLILGLALALGLGMGIPFALVFQEKKAVIFALALGVGIPLIQLPFHLILTPRIMKKRAVHALDTLGHNLEVLGRK